tara:strand:- start:262 stop:552 length:291 start_codon:yes stop_codon:yes gene_type:complete
MMNKIELAKWLHDNYEEVAKDKEWNTQENCKVEFDTLPAANKQTMIEIAKRLLNFDLLHLHIVSKSFTEKQMDDAYDKGFNDEKKRDLTGSLIEVL